MWNVEAITGCACTSFPLHLWPAGCGCALSVYLAPQLPSLSLLSLPCRRHRRCHVPSMPFSRTLSCLALLPTPLFIERIECKLRALTSAARPALLPVSSQASVLVFLTFQA